MENTPEFEIVDAEREEDDDKEDEEDDRTSPTIEDLIKELQKFDPRTIMALDEDGWGDDAKTKEEKIETMMGCFYYMKYKDGYCLFIQN